ncbi:TrmB family transcriptional regulator [Natronoarchaeum rubrum]|uniref:TrmB family transcriptional regulator n=1 Tax=Natronoarchaeum rubrum TaxID=755311 RepID=UPI0021128A47|nr:TrmB family transcriptional regulator [Natronoarchaeum rubrum]HMB50955.1 TrmB family transcriptional regulator [Natronoarchaeum rubrum]
MSVGDTRSETTVDALPDELDSPRAKLVYLYLSVAEDAALADLQETLDLKKITLFSILDTLQRRDLIEHEGETYAVAA